MLLALSFLSLGEGRGFLKRSVSDIQTDVKAVHQELQEALRGALGNGHAVGKKRIVIANTTLLPIFQSLPKNQHGRVGAAAMRYAVQRYFSSTHGWIIKGFESHSTEEQVQDGILGSKIPGYVEATLEGMLQKGGYGMPDILTVVIVVERLIFDEVARSVEAAYQLNHLATEKLLSNNELLTVIESHLIVEMMERHDFDEETHTADREEIHELYPNWHNLQDFVRDIVAMETSSVLQPGTRNPFSRIGIDTFSFDDAVRIAQRFSNEYGQWGNQECMQLRGVLSDIDSTATGRVPLADFYRKSETDERWVFQETPQYLRELGALDESSKVWGPRVIISNYAYGMSNCLSSTPYYSVCCINECEGLLQQIELHLSKPSATSREILSALENVRMTSISVDVSQLSNTLLDKLEEIAVKGKGNVPVHGRLFAQWLHYAFPNECPFPHVSGTVRPETQGERMSKGEAIFIEPEELSKHAQQTVHRDTELHSEAEEHELWSWDEELMHAPAPQERLDASHRATTVSAPCVGFIVLSILVAVMILNKAVASATAQRMTSKKEFSV
jgi:hypothetical protein